MRGSALESLAVVLPEGLDLSRNAKKYTTVRAGRTRVSIFARILRVSIVESLLVVTSVVSSALLEEADLSFSGGISVDTC